LTHEKASFQEAFTHMTQMFRSKFLAVLLTIGTCLAGTRAVCAQDAQPAPAAAENGDGDTFAATEEENIPLPIARPSLFKPFTGIFGDIKRLPSADNVSWLVLGMGAAAGARAADSDINRNWSRSGNQTFKPGAIVGGTPLELGVAFTTYAVGRAVNKPRAMNLGSDLIRAQLLGELLTTGLKQAVRRSRPEGSGYSFPSGHTTVTFASATVLQRHLGWKVGIPAYAVASYVAMSRVEMKRHYLSDVAFGAALGIVAGRTVTVGRTHRLTLTAIAAQAGGGIGFTWVGRH
jgi:membrane-associated phospholipid phosphatase